MSLMATVAAEAAKSWGALILAARSDDSHCAEVCRRLDPGWTIYARRYSPSHVDDCLQEARLRVHQNLAQVDVSRPDQEIHAWLRRLGRWAIRDYLQGQYRRERHTVSATALPDDACCPVDHGPGDAAELPETPIMRAYRRYVAERGTFHGAHSQVARDLDISVPSAVKMFSAAAEQIRQAEPDRRLPLTSAVAHFLDGEKNPEKVVPTEEQTRNCRRYTMSQTALAARRKAKPWRFSTGPRTAEGKRRVARNALKHGRWSREALAKARCRTLHRCPNLRTRQNNGGRHTVTSTYDAVSQLLDSCQNASAIAREAHKFGLTWVELLEKGKSASTFGQFRMVVGRRMRGICRRLKSTNH